MFHRISVIASLAGVTLTSVPALAAGSSVALRDGEVLLEVVGRATSTQTAQSVTVSYELPVGEEQGSPQLAAIMRANSGRSQSADERAKLKAAQATASKAAAALVERFHAAGYTTARLASQVTTDAEPDANTRLMTALGSDEGDHVVVVSTVPVPRIGEAIAIARSAGAKSIGAPTPLFSDVAPLRHETAVRAQADARQSAELYASSLNMRLARVLRISERGDSALVTPGGVSELIDTFASLGTRNNLRRTVPVTVAVDYALVPK